MWGLSKKECVDLSLIWKDHMPFKLTVKVKELSTFIHKFFPQTYWHHELTRKGTCVLWALWYLWLPKRQNNSKSGQRDPHRWCVILFLNGPNHSCSLWGIATFHIRLKLPPKEASPRHVFKIMSLWEGTETRVNSCHVTRFQHCWVSATVEEWQCDQGEGMDSLHPRQQQPLSGELLISSIKENEQNLYFSLLLDAWGFCVCLIKFRD